MVTEYRKQLDKETVQAFNKLLNACNHHLGRVMLLHMLWETSEHDSKNVGLKNPKARWKIFSEEAIKEGFTTKQLELFLLYSG